MSWNKQPRDNNTTQLLSYILNCPAKFNYAFNDEVRRNIRRALYFAASCEGKYLSTLFPSYSSAVNSLAWNDVHENISSNDHKLWQLNNSKHENADHSNNACSRIFKKGQPIYRCLTCGFDETCALCSYCYVPENHKGHKVHVYICQREIGGVCDCGDPEAWVKTFKCPHYSNETDEKVDVPEEFATSLIHTIEVLLDHVIDVMSKSNLMYQNFDTSATIAQYSENSCLDPKKYGGIDRNSSKYYLMVYNDGTRQYRDAVQRIHLASRKVEEFAIMVSNEVHTYGKAKVIGSENLDFLRERERILSSTGLFTAIRSYRDVFREDFCDEIVCWLYDLTVSSFFKSSSLIRGLFCEVMLRKWNKGTMDNLPNDVAYGSGKLEQNCYIPRITDSTSAYPVPEYWKYTPKKWDLPEDICRACEYNLDEEERQAGSFLGSRFQYFVYFDARFWKKIRLTLNDMYVSNLVTDLKYKKLMSCQYVDIYPNVADIYLNLDKEPEYSLMCSLSAQLFTSPSNSTAIVDHGDLTRMFAAIYGFLTVNRIITPNSVDLSKEVLYHSLKHRRWSQIFFDVSYVLSRSRAAKSILSTDILAQACDIIALMQGKPVIKREAVEHIEYESNDYGVYFSSVTVICHFAEYISKCVFRLKPEDFYLAENAISYVFNLLEDINHWRYPGISPGTIDNNFTVMNCETTPDNSAIIPSYKVNCDKISFLHPLHSFLSWLIQFANLKRETDVTQLQEWNSDSVLRICDYTLRTVVLLSQIKVGYWVRNGFSIRTQLHIYRNTGIRECGFMRDMFMTQYFINTCEPNLSCYFMINRWQLVSWMNGEFRNYEVYDPSNLTYMVEECINFLLNLLSEDTNLVGYSDDQISELNIKREILHTLCFKPLSYSKLCEEVPEHVATEKKFEIILKELATYSPPKGTTGVGTYKLNDKFFDEIDPYYIHFTSNRRDETIKILKERIHQKQGIPLKDVFLEPKKRRRSVGPYGRIGNFTTSIYLAAFIVNTLLYIRKEGASKCESMLDLTLHFLHTASVEDVIDTERSFYKIFINNEADGNTKPGTPTMASILYKMLVDESFSAHHPKIRAIFHSFSSRYDDVNSYLSHESEFDPFILEVELPQIQTESEFDRKKKLAKQRQSKLLAKFKKQQSEFIQQNNVHDLDKSDIEMDDVDNLLGWRFPEEHCLLCQNNEIREEPFGIISYVSKSSEFRNIPFDDSYWVAKAFSDSPNLDMDENENTGNDYSENLSKYMESVQNEMVIGPGFPCRTLGAVNSKLVSSSCGHGMHYSCYLNYVNGLKTRQAQVTRTVPESSQNKEFLCPLCKAINNVFIPVLWSSNKRSLSSYINPVFNDKYKPFTELSTNMTNEGWLSSFYSSSHKEIKEMAESTLTKASSKIMFGPNTEEKARLKSSIGTLMKNLVNVTFPYMFRGDSTILLVNTIKSIEISLRGVSSDGGLVISQLSNNNLINLRTWTEFRRSWIAWKAQTEVNSKSANGSSSIEELLANLVLLSTDSVTPSIIDADFFEILVSLFPVPSEGFTFNSLLQICFLFHVIQTIYKLSNSFIQRNYYLGNAITLLDFPAIENATENDGLLASVLFEQMQNALPDYGAQKEVVLENVDFGRVFHSLVVKCCTPFLRRAAIWSYVECADISGLEDLDNFDGDHQLEADKLCDFLKISRISDLMIKLNTPESFEGSKMVNFLTYIESHPEAHDKLEEVEYPGLVKLIKLPERLDHFFTKYYYPELKANRAIEDPAICLFCGEIVEIQKQAIGSDEGECLMHFQKECNNDYGMFLIPKHSIVLLFHRKNGSFHSAPYLDTHGELDEDSKHGQALYLSKERYDDLTRNLWLQHNVPNYVARKLESVIDIGGWETL